MLFYLIGSLRHPEIPAIGNSLRTAGFEIFDDWFAGGKIADDEWQAYETERGHSYAEALRGIAADHVFSFDKHHLDRADGGILVLPAGKSGHLELGYLAGQNKPTFVLFDKVPERWDVMYKFATNVAFSLEELIEDLRQRYILGPREASYRSQQAAKNGALHPRELVGRDSEAPLHRALGLAQIAGPY